MFTKRSLMHAYLTVPVKLRIVVIPLFYVPRMIGRKSYDGKVDVVSVSDEHGRLVQRAISDDALAPL